MTSRAKASNESFLGDSNKSEDIETIDFSKEADSLLKTLKKYLNDKSHSKQLAVGGVSGW